MIETIILQHLATQLDVPVSLEHPDPAPQRYVVFEKTGSSKANHLEGSIFAFQSYAESLYQAALLNDQVKEAVESLINLDTVVSVKLNTDYNFTDTETKRYRYQALYELKHY